MDLPIHVRYTPEKKDYVRASRVLARNTPGFMVIAVVILLAMTAAALILIIPGIGNTTWRNVALVVLLVGAFYVIYYFVFIPLQLSKAYKTNPYLQKEREFSFTEEQVIMEIGDKVTHLDWEHFQKVVDGGGFYLLIYQAEERVYPFVPKDAFEDQNGHDAFVELLELKSVPIG